MEMKRDRQSRVLMSGASGMLGAALRAALARNAQVLQLVRHAASARNELRWDPASNKPFDATDEINGVQVAIHLSGVNVAGHRWTPSYRRAIATSRVESTQALARVLAALPAPPAVLLVASATGIYGDRGDELITEDSAAGSGFLADVCRQWEAAAAPAVAAGIRVVHLRFGVVLGAGAGALGKMTPIFRLGLGGRLGSGTQWMSWIGIPDLVRAVQFLIDQPSIAGPVNIVTPNPVTNAEFTRALARRLHRPALFPAPAFALRLAFGQMAQETLLFSTRALPQRLTQAGFPFQYADIDSALAAALP